MTQSTTTLYRSYIIEEYHLTEEPYYVAVGDEVELFEAAYEQRIPLIFKGPTGCGKTRFVEYMSYRLGQPLTSIKQTDSRGVERPEGDNIPLVTIACHEDLTASDLVGRYLLEGDSTVWIDGPLTRAVKAGGICYLDEIVEARKDTTVLIHPLTDHRRILPVEKRGELLEAADGFLLILSYNPGYQSALKRPQAQHAPAFRLHRIRLSAARHRRPKSSSTNPARARTTPANSPCSAKRFATCASTD